MKKLLLLILLGPLTVFAKAPEMGAKQLDNSCGRLIAGLHPSLSWGDEVARVIRIDGTAQFDNRTRFKLSPGTHSIKFEHGIVGNKEPLKLTIEPNTNYYIQWVFDHKLEGSDKNAPLYSGPYIFKQSTAQCSL